MHMLKVSNVSLPLEAGLNNEKANEILKVAAAKALNVSAKSIDSVCILRRSIDARRKSNVHFNVTLGVTFKTGKGTKYASEQHFLSNGTTCKNVSLHKSYKPLEVPFARKRLSQQNSLRPLVVGAGPAGLFCALYLARAGLSPVLVERGSCVSKRKRVVDAFMAGGILNTNTNVCFGEGGAGTFSDGKLNTGTKSPWAKHVLHTFVDAGAPPEILIDAMPHIGTDKLTGVVQNMRKQIVAAGGKVLFDNQLVGVEIGVGKISSASILDIESGTTTKIPTNCIVLACGHSARDTFEMLHASGVSIEQKPFSVGVRIEHEQAKINKAQYGKFAASPALGAATYKLAVHVPAGNAGEVLAAHSGAQSQSRISFGTHDSNKVGSIPKTRGVYTFCMCPGGSVVCASTEPGGVCVNGMSFHERAGKNANSALLVDVVPADFQSNHPLAGVYFQRKIEQAAFNEVLRAKGAPYQAPAQTVGSFLSQTKNAKASVKPTYARGVVWCNLHNCLPSFVSSAIAQALPLMDKKLHGFASAGAVLTGVETRSSSPVRIVRSKETLQAKGILGLYPTGEGAGYAGGIMSAACDGLRVANAIVTQAMRAGV